MKSDQVKVEVLVTGFRWFDKDSIVLDGTDSTIIVIKKDKYRSMLQDGFPPGKLNLILERVVNGQATVECYNVQETMSDVYSFGKSRHDKYNIYRLRNINLSKDVDIITLELKTDKAYPIKAGYFFKVVDIVPAN